ncbi:MAG: NAD(+) synthase [Clostridiaceae bacterium]|nr:NAD(+) synthase [Oscillospiraceae bacterium]NLO62875.1 NAD(+) synthase [Clostridiaceae bacterium]
MDYGFIRVSVATPKLILANPSANAAEIAVQVAKAYELGASVVLFPELSLTGYTCGDLFEQQILRASAEEALYSLAQNTSDYPVLFAVGLPLMAGSKLYNCAAILCRGEILGFVPKRNLPNFGEFYERRHFSSGPSGGTVLFRGRSYPFGTNQIFMCKSLPSLRIAVEICEDLFVPSPPSSSHAVNGATVILNLSASDELVTKADYRRSLIRVQSARAICAYLYANAGFGESTTDMVFSGHNIIAENGVILGETPLFSEEMICRDIDLDMLIQDRIRQSTFPAGAADPADTGYRTVEFDLPYRLIRVDRNIPRFPFVPADDSELSNRCETILSIQASGLAKRMAHTGIKHAVIGLSGGLDSTLAFLVTHRAFGMLGLPSEGIHAITMPGFGTTDRTLNNAIRLAEAYGADLRQIDIRAAVTQHFSDIGQDPDARDITYENTQARERTQILMDIANQCGGFVIGTGDLSEIAIGWSTYNGDHMSMYAVNSSVPKTLIRSLIGHMVSAENSDVDRLLLDILNTPPSPELLPHDNNRITQITEDIVGPYELHDFFLYYSVRYGFSPKKIVFMAQIAFNGIYDKDIIVRWMKVFLKRFFSQQFKRSCIPDGPKVGSVCLSPRADWRMPSDATVAEWLADLED